MSATTPTPQRNLTLLIAAAVVVVVVVGLVLTFGVQRPPELPSLADQPEPAPVAAVAWATWEGRDGRCLMIARPDGSVEELVCRRDDRELIGFVDEGLVELTWSAGGEHLELIDPDTGEVLERRELRGGEHPLEAPGARGIPADVVVDHDDGRLQVTIDGTAVWDVEVGDAYDLDALSVAPDRSMAVAVDTAERLLLLPTDDTASPRVWVEDVDRWNQPIWQGTPLPAWEEAAT